MGHYMDWGGMGFGWILWSIIGFSAALTLTIYQDYGLLVAGVFGTILIFLRDKNSPARI